MVSACQSATKKKHSYWSCMRTQLSRAPTKLPRCSLPVERIPLKTRFRYRLDGQNHDWGDATDERAVFYADLKPGDYCFEVKAANPNGVWSESVALFAFSLAPHFWHG